MFFGIRRKKKPQNKRFGVVGSWDLLGVYLLNTSLKELVCSSFLPSVKKLGTYEVLRICTIWSHYLIHFHQTLRIWSLSMQLRGLFWKNKVVSPTEAKNWKWFEDNHIYLTFLNHLRVLDSSELQLLPIDPLLNCVQ